MCEDQKNVFLCSLGLNFHIHIVDVTRDLTGKLMLLMQEKFDSLMPADQSCSVGYRGKQSVFASNSLCKTFLKP